MSVGAFDGAIEGEIEGVCVGEIDGTPVGVVEGAVDGFPVGHAVLGALVGAYVIGKSDAMGLHRSDVEQLAQMQTASSPVFWKIELHV